VTAPETRGPKFRIGDKVRLRSRPDRAGVIIPPSPRLTYDEYWYMVFFGTAPSSTEHSTRHPESDLEPYGGSLEEVEDLVLGGLFGGREAFTKLLCHLRLTTALRSQIYSLQSSRTHFFAYQFKPVLKFLESRRHRLLIADEVGLGKTIETGLILTELRQRRPLRRILIVPPSHLVLKWRDEMRNRFGVQFQILDSRQALDFLRQYENELDETPLAGILSLQALRGKRLIERWQQVEPRLDLVVFDEAGRLRNAETKSHSAAELVASNADAVLLLTATPVQTHDEDLFNLLHLLEPEEFATYPVFAQRLQINQHVLDALRLLGSAGTPLQAAAEALQRVERTHHASYFRDNPLYRDLLTRLGRADKPTRRDRIELQRDLTALNMLAHILSRTRKREVQETQPLRRARTVRRDPTEAEEQFYVLVTRSARAAYRKLGNSSFAAFATMMPQRQAASCMVAMVDNLLDRGQSSEGSSFAEGSDLTPEDFDFDADERAPRLAAVLTPVALRQWRARLAEQDTKWASLHEVLVELTQQEPQGKVIVYSFFKRTLAYLAERLAATEIEAVIITGDVPSLPDDPDRDERGRRLRVFREDPRVRVLLATEVGDEGLDLQFCHTIVNYDLPWNPMKVEQRIGRIDRIGQRSPHVTVINLSMPGTIEDRILERIYLRIGIFERSIGDLETILGEEVTKLTAELFSRDLSSAEQEHLIEQAADVIERRRQEQDRWETDATTLIGHDEFFLDEITRARQHHRYVGGDELLTYLRDFLAANHRVCTITPTDSSSISSLHVDDGLREFVRQSVAGADPLLRSFLHKSDRGDVALTTSQEVAEANPDVEFLTFYHPLIRAVSRYYDTRPTELHAASYVRLRSGTIAIGVYAWFLYIVEITGARPLKDLELVALRLTDASVLSSDDSEALLGEMLVAADSVPPAQRSERVDERHVRQADDALAARLEAWFLERQRLNEALVTHRLTSIEQTFKRTQQLREDGITVARMRERRDSYIRGLETALRNLRAAHEVTVREITAGRTLGKSFKLRGAGVVEVTGHGRLAGDPQADQAATRRPGGRKEAASGRSRAPRAPA
jgi:superfamily II DNA or RNA helicase